MDKTLFNIFKETTKEMKLNLSIEEIGEIFSSQFKFLRDKYAEVNTKEQNKLPTIFIPELGRFYSKKSKEKSREYFKNKNIENGKK
jgi:hypothetical protein